MSESSLGLMITKEFKSSFYEEEIKAVSNGSEIFPRCSGTNDPRNYHVVNIHVSATGLPDVGIITKTDPICTISRVGPNGYEEYARTEVCWNYLNPWWVRPFTYTVPLSGESSELLTFDIYDVSSPEISLSQQRLLGTSYLDIMQLIDSPTHTLSLNITDSKRQDNQQATIAQLHLSYFDVNPDAYGSVLFKFSASNIKSVSRKFTNPNPFFVIQRYLPQTASSTDPLIKNSFIPVYKSGVQNKCTDCSWDNVELLIQFICGGDLDLPLRLCAYDFIARDTDNYLSYAETTMRELMNPSGHVYHLRNNQGEYAGDISVQMIAKIERPRFYDYQLMGVELSTIVAVDFSSTPFDNMYSNRTQHMDVDDLSYRSVMGMLFDEFRMLIAGRPISTLAFGDFDNKPKAFPISKSQSEMISFDSVLHKYLEFKSHVQYPDQAFLAPVIAEARKSAPINWEKNKAVTFLLILTNGIFNDQQEAIEQIISAVNEPIVISMVIMGSNKRSIEKKISAIPTLVNPDGQKICKRNVISVFHYEYTSDSMSPNLSPNLVLSTQKMFVDYLEMSDFKPFS